MTGDPIMTADPIMTVIIDAGDYGHIDNRFQM